MTKLKPTSRDLELARTAHKHLQSAIFKLKEALNNKKISGLLITEAEVASLLLALGEFGYEKA